MANTTRKRYLPNDYYHNEQCHVPPQQPHLRQLTPSMPEEEMDTRHQSNPITLIGLSHCCTEVIATSIPKPVNTRSSLLSIQSSQRLPSSSSSVAATAHKLITSSMPCKASPTTLRRQSFCSLSSWSTIYHVLLLLALSTTTVIANSVTGGLEAKKGKFKLFLQNTLFGKTRIQNIYNFW